MGSTALSLPDKLLVALVLIVIIALAIASFAKSYVEFKPSARYIRTEIKRSHGRTKRHWKRELRHLYINLFFPFIKFK